jgi:DNA polymerase-3 subunit epsilon
MIYDKLERDIVFFDLETTGTDIKNDRIVEISAIKYRKDKTKISFQKYFNPVIDIHPGAIEVHGLTNEFLKDYPTFKDSAKELYEFFDKCDLGGYNCVRFDIPLLYEEFSRNGYYPNWFNLNVIDSYNLLNKFETRKLNDVYNSFFGKDIENNHSATDDIEATIKIFEKQVEKYGLEDKSLKEISDIIRSNEKGERIIDLSGWFKIKDGVYLFNKGKHKDTAIKDNLGYLEWIKTNNNMDNNTRVVAKILYDKIFLVK